MARPPSELQAILAAVEGVKSAWFQEDPSRTLTYPAIVFERSNTFASYADNLKYLFMKRYTVTVIDRSPASLIPDRIELLPLTSFDRFFRQDGLNHFVFNLYF